MINSINKINYHYNLDQMQKANTNISTKSAPDSFTASFKGLSAKQPISIAKKAALYLRLSLEKAEQGRPRFSQEDTKLILSSFKKGDDDILETILSAKNHFNDTRFKGNEIKQILKNNQNDEVTKKLIKTNSTFCGADSGLPHFNTKQIISIQSNTNPKNEKALDLLINSKIDRGTYEFPTVSNRFLGHEIAVIMKNCKSEADVSKLESILKEAGLKAKNGFEAEDIFNKLFN